MKLIKLLRKVVIVIVGIVLFAIITAMIIYPPQYIYRVLAWQESDVFDWKKFPFHPLNASAKPFHFMEAPDPRVEELFQQLSGAEDWNGFLEKNQTQAFIVIKDSEILYEKYFNNTQRDSIVTTVSVAKSFDSALIGIAIQEGFIKSVDDPITKYLPELSDRDLRFNEITIRHLLLMSSGMEYEELRPLLFNSDDILTTYHPNQRKISLENTKIIDPPGQYFQYNKYHPQLLGMILERATNMPVSEYLQTRIWDRLGMEYGGSWSIDSKVNDFEKMETGINARAIDFAKFGVLFLNGGNWQGTQVISKNWVDESTQPLLPSNYNEYYSPWFNSLPGKAFYKYMWWGMDRGDGYYDFSAEGDKGQYIYISPMKKFVIVRNGINFGIPSEKWLQLFYDFSGLY